MSTRVPVDAGAGRSAGRRLLAGAGAVALVPVAVALGLLAATGALSAAAYAPFDPGVLVRYGQPVARAVQDLAAAVTVGALVLGAWAIPPGRGRAGRASAADPGPSGPDEARDRSRRIAARAGVCWLVAAVTVLTLTAAEVSGVPPGSPGFGAVAVSFATQVDLGRALAASLLLAAGALTLLTADRRHGAVVGAAVLAVAALLPLALAGHATGSEDHMNAVDSLALHLVGTALWVGGLAALLLLAPVLRDDLGTVAGRYSTLAGCCFVVVAGSGVVNAALRLGSVDGLSSDYGRLVLAKAAALILLGTAGWLHRRRTLPAIGTGRTGFVRLAAAEIVLMAATIGLAVALSRSAPPATETGPPDPVAALLGHPVPPPLSVHSYLTAFYPSLLWLVVAAGLAIGYVAGVVRLRRRGVRWPWSRLAAWLAGCAALVWVTSGGVGYYGTLHFSTHMVQHMSLMVLVPLLWVLGAPVTLALRALRARTDGSFGPRETLLALVHSRYLRLLGNPIVAAALFTVGLIVFYYTRLFPLALFTHTGHVLMTTHFLAAGYLFVWSLVGTDPGPARPAYPFRVVVLLSTMAFHAFFGVSLMSSELLLAPDWWHALGQSDDAALLADQQAGGSIAWASGDLPSLLIGLALVVGWVRSDTRRARQLDRRADRDGDADLRAYNEQLAALHRRDPRS